MKLSSLRPRILLSAVASSGVALILVWIAGSTAGHGVTSEMDRGNVTVADLNLCQREPALWSKALGGFLTIYAYDVETGLSVNPGAPPLDAELAGMPLESGVPVVRHDGFGRVTLLRMGDAGPCSLFQTWILPPPSAVIHAHAVSIGVGGVLAIFTVAGLTLLFAVNPVVRRVRRLRDSAQQVGREEYLSAQDRVGDDLSQISTVLDASHDRIRTDRAELVSRHEALERHLAEVAHDLRTPLASLLLVTEELSDAPGDDVPKLAARALEDTVYLDALVDNLRQATLLRHGMDPGAGEARADLCDVVRRVGQRFAALGRRRGVSVEHAAPDGPVWVGCAQAVAERAVANLVHNAVIHGRPGGHVALLLECVGGRFSLAVMDDGPGLPPERLADLGQRTFTDDPVRPRDQGLGLAITNEVCRRAGWGVRYEAMEEGGLRVLVEGGVFGRQASG